MSVPSHFFFYRGKTTRLLCPKFDMFNHDQTLEQFSSHRWNVASKCVHVVATRNYAKGELCDPVGMSIVR